MNSILNFINSNPISAIIIISLTVLSMLFIIGWELPQKTVKSLTVFYREQKLFYIYPRSVSIFFERCFPINQNFVIPDIGDYIRVNKHGYKGYTMLKADTWEHEDLTWEQVVAIAKNH